jgi:hypothetical protein
MNFKRSLASDLVASLKFALWKEGGIVLHGLKEGHAAVFFPSLPLLLQLDSYLALEQIEVDEDGEPLDIDEDGMHDPKKVYLTAIYGDGRKKEAQFLYNNKPAIEEFLKSVRKN